MTVTDLQALLDAEDTEGCIAFFAKATETERRKLAKTAAARLKAVTAEVPARLIPIFAYSVDDQIQRLFPEAAAKWGGLRAAQVAVLATATLAELTKFGERCRPRVEDAFAVLSARRPEWIDGWVEMLLTASQAGRGGWTPSNGAVWPIVRRLVREGLCARPQGAAYIHSMIVAGAASQSGRTLREALLDDPGLLDDEVWEIFTTEPIASMLGALSSYPGSSEEHRWDMVLARFAGEGRISRTRLLEACLAALARDVQEAWSKSFITMHDTLRPTLDEQAERADRYLGLAASRNASTVTFALKVLTELDAAGRLESDLIVGGVGPALLARAKGTVRSALDLIDRAARRVPGFRARAAALAVDALAHESPEVHKAVLDLVERHGDRADAALRELLRARQDTVAASQRARLASWLGPEAVPAAATETTAAEVDDLLARASGLDPDLAERAGVAVALDVLKQDGGEVPAIELLETDVPRLDPERRIVPVTDLDELIGLFAAILEDPLQPDDLERVLDGVSRLCDRTPEDFAVRTGPLRARADQPEQFVSNLLEPLRALALSWTGRQGRNVRLASLNGYLAGIFARRVLALAGRAAQRQAAPLLSAPTHRGGWIDPRVLVERARFWESSTFRHDRLDASFALLRLAPDAGPRAEALRAAAELEGPFADALRYALGGESQAVGPDARLWIAAARARAPLEDDMLVEARHPGLGPDAGRAALCFLRPGPHTFTNWLGRSDEPLIARKPPLPPAYQYDLPTVLLHDERARGATGESCWIATIWPLGHDSFFAAGAEGLLGRECMPTEARMFRPFLERLLDPDAPLRMMARLLLASALSSNQPELQGLGVDALIAAVDDGRLDGRLLGEAILRLQTEGLAKPSRVVKALGDAGRVSALHTRVVAQALQLVLAGLSSPPKDLHVILELLKELLAETGGGLSSPAATYLRALKVSGKTAKLAKDLLGLAGGSDNALNRRAAVVRALAGRVERAERWGRCQQESQV